MSGIAVAFTTRIARQFIRRQAYIMFSRERQYLRRGEDGVILMNEVSLPDKFKIRIAGQPEILEGRQCPADLPDLIIFLWKSKSHALRL